MELNKIVKKLSKRSGDIMYVSDFEELIESDYIGRESALGNATYRLVRQLKDQGVIVALRSGVFHVGALDTSIPVFVESSFWKLAKKAILHHTNGDYVVVGPKALEMHQRNYESPTILHVSTRDVAKKITLYKNRELQLQSIRDYEGKSLYPLIHRYSEMVEIEGIKYRIAGKELTLLEALTHKRGDQELDLYIVKRFLKRYHQSLSEDIFHELVQARYISAINRLRELSRDLGYTQLYEITVRVIRRSGKGCFLTLNTK